jgi:hypothetical protein
LAADESLGVGVMNPMLGRMERNWIRPMIFVAAMVAVVYAFTMIFSPSLGRPSEANRVRHPDGYSIVAPDAFIGRPILAKPGTSVSAIELEPRTSSGPTLSVTILRRPDEPGLDAKWSDFTFQNRPARAWEGPVGQQHEARIKFERDGSWFMISVRMIAPQGVLRGQWMSFLNTFRYAPPPSSPGSGAS